MGESSKFTNRANIALAAVSVCALLLAGFSISLVTQVANGQAEGRVEPIACETGAPGQTGATGPSGAPGQTGATGAQGSAGIDGVCVTLAPTSTGLGYYGSFFSKVSQENISQVNKMTFDTTSSSAGVNIVDGSKITFANSGTYNLAFSAQFDKTDSGQDTVDVWLSNASGVISWTNTKIDNNNNNGKVVAAWNFFVTVNAGEYVELNWYSSDASMRVYAQNSATNPVRPEIPSVILTVNQIN